MNQIKTDKVVRQCCTDGRQTLKFFRASFEAITCLFEQ